MNIHTSTDSDWKANCDTQIQRRRTSPLSQEIGAEVIRGPVRYPSELGDTEVGGVDIGE